MVQTPPQQSYISAYGTSATQHWTKCTEDEDNNGTAEDHSWSDGKCSVCQYTCTHGEQTTGTCSTCGKNLGSGSQGSPTPTPIVTPTLSPVSAEQRQREDVELLEYTVSKEEALPVTSFASVAAVNAIPAEAKTGNDLTYNISSVTTIPGFVAAVNKIANASPVSVMSVYSSEPMALNAAVISAITNTGKTFVYTFTYKGHIYKVTIPAGAKISTNGQHFMGPLAVGAQLGTTQIVK